MYESLSPRYVVVTRVANAPKSGAGKYRRPVHVRVLDTARCHPSRNGSVGAVCEWRNVDSRYSGPRAAYGRAIRAARELADRLNTREQYTDYGAGI